MMTYNVYNIVYDSKTGTYTLSATSPVLTGATVSDKNDGGKDSPQFLGDRNKDLFDAGGNEYTYLGITTYTHGGTGQDTAFIGMIGKGKDGSHQLFVPTDSPAPSAQTGRVTSPDQNVSSTWWDPKAGAPACFLAGTRIATPSGERAVEVLSIGDLVLTADGRAVPVRWVGRSTVTRAAGDPLLNLPILVRAGALGEGLPARDLGLSGGHAVLVEGVLVNAAALVNGTTVVRDWSAPDTYMFYHLELDAHEVILAESLPTESFLAGAEDRSFDNWDERVGPAQTTELPYPRAFSARQVPVAVLRKLEAHAIAEHGVASAA